VALSNAFMDMVNNPGASSGAVSGTISGLVDSHYLYFCHSFGGTMSASGTVTFSGNILGVEFTGRSMALTDPLLAPAGTHYSGLFRSGVGEVFSINGNVLTFDLQGSITSMDTAQLRIVTEHVPAPSAFLPLFAGLVAPVARRARRPAF
jgi:hypothetical protein